MWSARAYIILTVNIESCCGRDNACFVLGRYRVPARILLQSWLNNHAQIAKVVLVHTGKWSTLISSVRQGFKCQWSPPPPPQKKRKSTHTPTNSNYCNNFTNHSVYTHTLVSFTPKTAFLLLSWCGRPIKKPKLASVKTNYFLLF